MKFKLHLSLTFFLLFSLISTTYGKILHIGPGQAYAGLMQAIPHVLPGDTMMIHEGIYAGGLTIFNLKGTDAKWIMIMAKENEEIIFQGGTNSWQMIDAAYIHIKGIIFQNQTGNGFNIDDGGDYSTPAHHIIFEKCVFRDIQATGNNDLLKMSGVDHFEIKECRFLNGSQGGSGVDMVGCHNGIIHQCYFEQMGSNSIQAKGGCEYIRIERNYFKNGGNRSLNLGGSTGLQYFRPLDARFEAARIKVLANVFVGSEAPVAFVGCIETEVINNTIYLPGKWVLRILQETVDTSRFFPCSNNIFRNNLIYKDNKVSTDCNIGPNTMPETFIFSNNLWYHSQNPGWAGPATLPVTDHNSLINTDPLFEDMSTENFALQPGSPAIGKGFDLNPDILDFPGHAFSKPPSIGAFEGNPDVVQVLNADKVKPDMIFYPNPVLTTATIITNFPGETCIFEVYNAMGNLLLMTKGRKGVNFLELSTLSSGMYVLRCCTTESDDCSSVKFIK